MWIESRFWENVTNNSQLIKKHHCRFAHCHSTVATILIYRLSPRKSPSSHHYSPQFITRARPARTAKKSVSQSRCCGGRGWSRCGDLLWWLCGYSSYFLSLFPSQKEGTPRPSIPLYCVFTEQRWTPLLLLPFKVIYKN